MTWLGCAVSWQHSKTLAPNIGLPAMMCASERLAFFSERLPTSKARSKVGPDRQATVVSMSLNRRTPSALVWAFGLGWGAFLGYQQEGLLQFVAVALSLAAITLWWERK